MVVATHDRIVLIPAMVVSALTAKLDMKATVMENAQISTNAKLTTEVAIPNRNVRTPKVLVLADLARLTMQVMVRVVASLPKPVLTSTWTMIIYTDR